MTATSPAARAGQEPASRRGWRTPAPRDMNSPAPGPGAAQAAGPASAAGTAHAHHNGGVRSWPLLLLAVPAAVTVWSGWVGIGRMTGFGQVHPLPGIWDALHLNTAVTLPVGVEAYAAYALRAWLATSLPASGSARRFARWSAIGSLLLGAAGQAAYHLLAEAGTTRAPWGITTAVSCLPVLVLGMGAALAHLLRTDTHSSTGPGPAAIPVPDQTPDQPAVPGPPGPGQPPRPAEPRVQARLAEARAAAGPLAAAGRRVSRRALRAAGLHGSNADLGTLARILTTELTTTRGNT